MSRHVVTEEELDSFAICHWLQFASHCGGQSNKKLEISLNGLYRVWGNGNLVYVGGLKETAIREYNALP